MKYLRLIIFNILVWLVPFIIVFYSITYQSGQVSTYQKPFASSNIHKSVEDGINISEGNLSSSRDVATDLMIGTITNNLATKTWINNLAERNFELLTDWWNDDISELYFYFPGEEVAQVAVDGISSEVNDLSTQNLITVCSDADIERITREGFDESSPFCLPEDVINGQVAFTEYFEYDTNTVYDSLFSDSFIRPNQEKYLVSSLGSGVTGSFIYNRLEDLKSVRSAYGVYLGYCECYYCLYCTACIVCLVT